jgi:phosphoribosylformimino-5-aminoimidazole carboxamide ribotide isomerase
VIAIPALDLRDGACVQLVGGDYSQERVRLNDPLQALRTWEQCGFTRAHIVDLDAATEQGSNAATVASMLGATKLELQVGGGLRTEDSIRSVLAAGARYAVLGTRAIEDPQWLVEIASACPNAIIVAADVRGGHIVTRGWKRALPRDVVDLLTALNELPLAGVLVTAVHVEGQLRGPDLALAERVTSTSRWPVLMAGGIASLRDLTDLAERGVAGAIIGMALYTGALEPRAVAQEFAA